MLSSRNYLKDNVIALGDPWFKARMQLAKAFRSLPRPSSQLKPSYPSNSLIGSDYNKIIIASLNRNHNYNVIKTF